jgi:glyoxylase-like metal-dependent hydrolase (beta-lactamase superfamily II)
MANFVYLVHDHASGRAAVVDPAWEPEQVLRLAREKGARITDILLTHSHADHVNGIDAVLRAYDAEVHLLKAEARFWGYYQDLPTLHHGGEVIALGETPIEVLHTPGHTPGSACYRVGESLLAGDTLFVFGCGRCDLHGGDPEAMYATLKRLTEGLPAETVLRPGHHYAASPTSTLREQAAGNPFLHFDDVHRFVAYRMRYHDRHRHEPYGPVDREAIARLDLG